MEDEDALGRRATDRYPGPEAVGVLLAQIRADIADLKVDVKEGFADFRREFEQVEKRLNALERFRERVEERDRALAKSEGNLSIRLPILAAFIGVLGVVVAVVTTLVNHS